MHTVNCVCIDLFDAALHIRLCIGNVIYIYLPYLSLCSLIWLVIFVSIGLCKLLVTKASPILAIGLRSLIIK